MVGDLTTHVLDTARGCPAGGLKIEHVRLEGGARAPHGIKVTIDDGRTDGPILPESALQYGTFELVFRADAYLDAAGVPTEDPRFPDGVPIRFGVSEDASYHVPLLLSPYGSSTYRGSGALRAADGDVLGIQSGLHRAGCPASSRGVRSHDPDGKRGLHHHAEPADRGG